MTGIVACAPTEETRARVQVAWDEYDKAVQVDGRSCSLRTDLGSHTASISGGSHG